LSESDRPNASVLLINRPIVTQEDVREYLALKFLYEQKRDGIIEAMRSGAELEPGPHAAHLDFKLSVR
jgi:hypothetical protein